MDLLQLRSCVGSGGRNVFLEPLLEVMDLPAILVLAVCILVLAVHSFCFQTFSMSRQSAGQMTRSAATKELPSGSTQVTGHRDLVELSGSP